MLRVGQGKERDHGKTVKSSLYLAKHHSMKMYGGVEIQLHAFLTSELVGDK
jgi:hypothetical protein